MSGFPTFCKVHVSLTIDHLCYAYRQTAVLLVFDDPISVGIDWVQKLYCKVKLRFDQLSVKAYTLLLEN
jgi:hypothetical protein